MLSRAADATVRITGGRNALLDRMMTFPTLLWLHEVFGVTVDTLAESILLLGSVLSATAAFLAVFAPAGGVALVWVALFGCYLSLFAVGQTFLSFQWDILLLKPFLCVFLCSAARPCSKSAPLPAAIWLLRLLAFKLMLMSGAVKIQSGCPTWHRLTALDYHWATQPLPTPLAWFARRYTSSAVRKLGVALTLSLEGPGTLMLIAPFRVCRHIGATAQILLQVAIAATGNYTFFNLLTVALMAACYDDAGRRACSRLGRRKESPRDGGGGGEASGGDAGGEDSGGGDDGGDGFRRERRDDADFHASDSDHHRDLERRTLFRRRRRRRRRLFRLDRFPRPRGGLDARHEPGRPSGGSRRTATCHRCDDHDASHGPEFDDPYGRGRGRRSSRFRRIRRRRELTLVELLVDFSSSRITRRAARVVSFALGSVFSAAVLANCAVMFQVAREEGKLPRLSRWV